MIDRRVRDIALLVAACFFMELLDGTIVITAIPRISASLGISPGATGLVVTAYLVTVAVLIALSGWVTLRYGYMRLMSYTVWPALVAPVIAPLAGGVITTLCELAMAVLDPIRIRSGYWWRRSGFPRSSSWW